jgi:hypothetical protein
MGSTDPEARPKHVYRVMTVALIREQREAVEVAFSESARFYILWRKHPEFATLLLRLREAKTKSKPISVLVDYPEGNIIYDARPADSAAEEPA